MSKNAGGDGGGGLGGGGLCRSAFGALHSTLRENHFSIFRIMRKGLQSCLNNAELTTNVLTKNYS